MNPRLPAAALVLLAALPVFAHDYWLQPDTFFIKPGESTSLHLHVGDDYVSEKERPFQKKPTVRFELLSGKEKQDLTPLGEEDKTPVARITLKTAGTHLVVMERGPQQIELEAEKFNKYLAEEGLEAILEERRKAGEDKAPGRERYRRFLKALLQAGDARDDETATRTLGQQLEIVPLRNPYALKKADTLAVRIRFDGKALAGAKVFLHRRAGEKVTTQTARTAADGGVSFKLDGEGSYLLRLVHMRRAAGDKECDWESFWGALTFGVK